MKISVLMPVYRTPINWVMQAVDSILSQTYADIQLVIVNDNNPIGELYNYLYYDLISRSCRVLVVRTTENKGVAAALNTGLRHCIGDVVMRMDADDIAHPTLVEKHAEFFTQYPDRHICGVQIKLFSEGKTWQSHHPREVTRELAAKSNFWIVNHPGIAFRRSTVMQLGMYGDTPANLAEDYALWVKFLLAGYTIYNREEILLDYRVHGRISEEFSPDRHTAAWRDFLIEQRNKLKND